jgi:hypothetical protein
MDHDYYVQVKTKTTVGVESREINVTCYAVFDCNLFQ